MSDYIHKHKVKTERAHDLLLHPFNGIKWKKMKKLWRRDKDKDTNAEKKRDGTSEHQKAVRNCSVDS